MKEFVALLDLGSNAIRLLLARLKPDQGFRVLRSERVQTRLGGGAGGVLPRAAVTGTLSAVQAFLDRARNGRDPRVVAIATAAVRDAPNREVLLRPLREREGVRVRVLSAGEEARLGALAVMWSLPVREGLIAELGGGSLQHTRLRDGVVAGTRAMPLGAVRVTRRFLRHDPATPLELRRLRSEIRTHLEQSLPVTRRGEELVGLGGTVRTLASMHLRLARHRPAFRHGLRIHQTDVTAIRARLEALSERKRRRMPGLRAERADIILSGAIVVEELMTLGGFPELIVCIHGVRDGVLLREAARHEGHRRAARRRPRD
jgi:exopolyphosphatase/guanosine-5'-triphosphate,3'-diphosphate pyrophosphatase